MTFSVSDACLDVLDLSCLPVCPVDCIYTGERRVYIHPGECIDCGVCLPACPVDAISAEGYAGPGGSAQVADNLAAFVEVLPGRTAAIGSPGSAHSVGPLGADTARVRSLPLSPPG